MNVTSKISVDMTRQNVGQRVNAVQGDGNTRQVEIILLAGGDPWTPPEGVEAAIAYMQPGGTKGLYNKLADGTAAISISGNVATINLAPQMLTASGTVQASLVFNDQQLNRLTTFPFAVSVTSNPFAGAQKVEDYLRLQWLEDKLEEYLSAIKASGVFDGKPGYNGVTFTPSVSENGDLSWRNNGGLPNPQTVNILGPQGDSTAATAAANSAKTSAANAETHAAAAATSAAAAQEAVGAMGTELSQIKQDLSDNANANAETRRKMDYLWKLNQGITYQFETDAATAYSKTAPSGAMVANVGCIGGHTEVIASALVSAEVEAVVNRGRNLINAGALVAAEINGITFVPEKDGSISVSGTASKNAYITIHDFVGDGREYTISGCPVISTSSQYAISIHKGERDNVSGQNEVTRQYQTSRMVFATVAGEHYWVHIFVWHDISIDAVFHPQLTAGDEDYPFRPYTETRIHVPAAVRALPGYGWSAGEAYNSIERMDTGWQYVQRVGSRAYQNGDVVTDGVTTFYALDNPVITDITNLMNGALDAIPVEVGGTLTFDNAAKLPVPSSVEYLISLAEVNG